MTPLIPTGESGLSQLLHVLTESLGFGRTFEMLTEFWLWQKSLVAEPLDSPFQVLPQSFHLSFGMALGLFV